MKFVGLIFRKQLFAFRFRISSKMIVNRNAGCLQANTEKLTTFPFQGACVIHKEMDRKKGNDSKVCAKINVPLLTIIQRQIMLELTT